MSRGLVSSFTLLSMHFSVLRISLYAKNSPAKNIDKHDTAIDKMVTVMTIVSPAFRFSPAGTDVFLDDLCSIHLFPHFSLVHFSAWW